MAVTENSNRAPRVRRLLIMLPALNEAATLKQVIDRIPKTIDGVDDIEVLVIDDGSTDDTVACAREAGASVVSHPYNLGVGTAVQTGLKEARRRGVDLAVNIDSDGQFDPQDIPRLIEPILNGRADFCTASRFKDPALVPEMPKVKRFGNWAMARIVSVICRQRFTDVSCGFRAYEREAILRLILLGKFTYTQESLISLALSRLRMVEVPLKVRGEREHGKSRVASNLLRYATRTSAIIFNVIRDYRPSRFFNPFSGVVCLAGVAIGGFFFAHYLATGSFSPHLWAGFLAAFLLGVGLLIFFVGQIAEMIARLRVIQEQQLYLLRRHLEPLDADAQERDPGIGAVTSARKILQ